MTIGNRESSGDDRKTAESVLTCIENEGPLSRAAVAKKLDLSRTTLSNLIARFKEQNLVSEREGEDPQGRGRPGIPVDLDTSTWFALGAEFHSRRWVFAITNLKGELVSTKTIEPAANDPTLFLDSLIKGIVQLRQKIPGRLLPAVGIGVPGLVNWEKGLIIRADDLGWEMVDIRSRVERETGLAAYVLNRNRGTGFAEAKYGLGKNVDNFVYIGVGTGISAAIMLHGDLLHGSSYSAGEIGHITVEPNGPLCGCGKRGCLQTLSAGGALVRRARELAASGKRKASGDLGRALAGEGEATGEMICREAMRGDRLAQACVREAATYLGMEVGGLITTLNPRKVIIGGPLVRVGSILVDYVRDEAAKWAMAVPFSNVSIEASRLDEYAGALGAACLVLRHKLELTD